MWAELYAKKQYFLSLHTAQYFLYCFSHNVYHNIDVTLFPADSRIQKSFPFFSTFTAASRPIVILLTSSITYTTQRMLTTTNIIYIIQFVKSGEDNSRRQAGRALTVLTSSDRVYWKHCRCIDVARNVLRDSITWSCTCSLSWQRQLASSASPHCCS